MKKNIEYREREDKAQAKPADSFKGLKNRLEKLPALSLRAYRLLQDELLYAEAGFTDVTSESWAQALEITQEQIKGVITKLSESGLVWSWNPNSQGDTLNDQFYGTFEHRDSENWTDAGA